MGEITLLESWAVEPECQGHSAGNVLSTNRVGKTWYTHAETMKLDPYRTQQKKINSEWIKILNASAQTIKLSEGNMGRKSHGIWFDGDSLDSKGTSSYRNIDRVDSIKIKALYTSKAMISRAKRQPTEREKTFASHFSKKELTPKIYKELVQQKV